MVLQYSAALVLSQVTASHFCLYNSPEANYPSYMLTKTYMHFVLLLPIKNKFHILFSKYYHCFVTKDTRVITTKLPESQTHNNAKINHKNIQIKILMQNK